MVGAGIFFPKKDIPLKILMSIFNIYSGNKKSENRGG